MIVIFKTVAKNENSYQKLAEINEKNSNLGIPELEHLGDDEIVSIGVEFDDIVDFDEGKVTVNGKVYDAICCRAKPNTYLPYFISTLDEFLEILRIARPDLVVVTKEEILNGNSKKDDTSTT